MRFFTRELWAGLQDSASFDECDRTWMKNFDEYKSVLNKLEHRFDKKSWKSINSANLHDGEIINVEIIDRNMSFATQDGKNRPKRRYKNPIIMFIRVFSNGYCYTLNYNKVSDIGISFKSEGSLFSSYLCDFGDWGYDEYSEVNDKVLAHDILFSSGAELHIEFGSMRFTQRKVV